SAEAIRVHAELLHQRDVLGVAPIVIAGNVAGIVVAEHPRRMRKALQDAGARAVGKRGAFDLIGGRRAAPEKARGKLDALRHVRLVTVYRCRLTWSAAVECI